MRARIEPPDDPPGILQDGMPPYTMRCLRCGLVWEPKAKRGAKVTDGAFDREAETHMAACR